jgi:hypothetical protein
LIDHVGIGDRQLIVEHYITHKKGCDLPRTWGSFDHMNDIMTRQPAGGLIKDMID